MARTRMAELPVGFIPLEPNRGIATIEIGPNWPGPEGEVSVLQHCDRMLIRLRATPGLDDATLKRARDFFAAKGATVKVLPIQRAGMPAQVEEQGVQAQTIREAIATRLAKSPEIAEYVWGVFDAEDKGGES